MAFEHFPYTNFHDLNLDFMLEKFKAIQDSIGTFIDQWEGIKEDYAINIKENYKEKISAEFQQITDEFNDMVRAWEQFRDIDVPMDIANKVTDAEQEMQTQYNAFFERYSREWGLATDFGTSDALAPTQRLVTDQTMHHLTPGFTEFGKIPKTGYLAITQAQLNNITDKPANAVTGIIINYGNRTEIVGVLQSDERMQMYCQKDGKIYYRTAPGNSDDFTEWKHIGAVDSVNGHEGDVMLTALDVGASPAGELRVGASTYTVIKTTVDAPAGPAVLTFVTE